MGHNTRIMYIECKAEDLNGPAWIGRVTYSKTGTTIYYRGKSLRKWKGYRANHCDLETMEEYWVSGPRRDGADRLYASNLPVEIDEYVREEYWTVIRRRPDLVGKKYS